MIRLHETLIGDPAKPMVVFCHGLFGQGKNFTAIAKAISDTHCSLLVDLPNHGRSDWTDEIGYPQMTADVVDWVQAHHGDRLPAAWVGHSMGGKVVMRIALTRPELVDRLVVVDMSPAKTGAMIEFNPIWAGLCKVDLATVGSRQEVDEIVGTEVRNRTVRAFLMQNLHRHHDTFSWQPNLALLRENKDVIADWPPIDATYEGPVAWIAGEHSGYVRQGNMRGMRALFPHVVKQVIPRSGHWVHSEQAELFTQALREFLSQS